MTICPTKAQANRKVSNTSTTSSSRCLGKRFFLQSFFLLSLSPLWCACRLVYYSFSLQQQLRDDLEKRNEESSVCDRMKPKEGTKKWPASSLCETKRRRTSCSSILRQLLLFFYGFLWWWNFFLFGGKCQTESLGSDESTGNSWNHYLSSLLQHLVSLALNLNFAESLVSVDPFHSLACLSSPPSFLGDLAANKSLNNEWQTAQ